MLPSLFGGQDDKLDIISVSICESKDSNGDVNDSETVDSLERISLELNVRRDAAFDCRSSSTPIKNDH